MDRRRREKITTPGGNAPGNAGDQSQAMFQTPERSAEQDMNNETLNNENF